VAASLQNPPKKSNKFLESALRFSVSPSISFRGEEPFYDDIISQSSQETVPFERQLTLRNTPEGKNGWFLGIMTRKLPKEIMKSLVNILNTSGFQWKLNSNIYRLRCRKIYNENQMLKMSVQLFKIRSKAGKAVHIIDFKIVEGDILFFLEEYSKIQKEIKSLFK